MTTPSFGGQDLFTWDSFVGSRGASVTVANDGTAYDRSEHMVYSGSGAAQVNPSGQPSSYYGTLGLTSSETAVKPAMQFLLDTTLLAHPQKVTLVLTLASGGTNSDGLLVTHQLTIQLLDGGGNPVQHQITATLSCAATRLDLVDPSQTKQYGYSHEVIYTPDFPAVATFTVSALVDTVAKQLSFQIACSNGTTVNGTFDYPDTLAEVGGTQ